MTFPNLERKTRRPGLSSFGLLAFSWAFLLGVVPVTAWAQVGFGPVGAYHAAIGNLVSADLDGDGDVDLVSDDGGSTRVSVLLNLGDGTFAPQVVYTVPVGTRALAAADMNGDTHVDIIVARAGPFPTGDGILSILLNDGFGNFGTIIDYSVIPSPVMGQQLTPMSVEAADLDSDGDLDLALATVLLNDIGQSGFFSVVFNVGNDGLGRPILSVSANIDASQSFSRDIVARDLDNDADIDLAVVSSLSSAVNSVSVILNNGDGTFGVVNNVRLTGAATTAFSLTAGDVNGDTFLDLVTMNGAHTYSVLLNLNGGTDPAKAGKFRDQGQFLLGSQALPATDIPSGGAAIRDLDGDGDQELIAGLAGDSGPGSLAVFVNPGTGLFGPELTIAQCHDFGNLIAADLDGDGDIDIAAGDASIQRVLVLLNELVPAVPASGDPADADGDGVPDCSDGCPFDPAKSAPGTCGCAGSFIVSACDDGDACTTGDVCSSGVCLSGSPTVCDDGNGCTDDSCNSTTGCVFTPVVGRACDDGNACTQLDTCDASGVCVAGAPLNCNDQNPCTDDSCNLLTGCANVPNTAACNDGDSCTAGDVCDAGACMSGAAVVCDDGNLCTDDSCNSATGCVFAPVAGRVCNDGNECTTTDVCDAAGVCSGSGGPNCNDNNPCTDDSCNLLIGCTNVPNTAPCDDGDACTVGDVCSASVCMSGAAVVCDDGNLCTDDSCDPVAGCIAAPVSGRTCDDGDACTTGDTCDAAGSCVGGVAPNCDDGNVCTDDSCDPVAGCIAAPVSGRTCDDGDACTIADTCNAAGGCMGGAAPNCDDGNVCTDDFCDMVTGCNNVPNASACDDGDACTMGETCAAGVCANGTPLDCNDGNICTDDSCHAATGCANIPNAMACDDSDACTVGDACVSGVCVSGAPATCDDGNICTDDSCNPAIGCVATPVVGRACEDGSACTVIDTCDAAGSCIGGVAPNCDDGNVCTDDACDPVAGCVAAPVSGRVCDDSDACTTADTCDAAGSCVGGAAPNCDDGNVCTGDSCDAILGCQHTVVFGLACNDGRDCTINDSCDALGLCVGDDSACVTTIPAVSSWGLGVMLLLLLTMGTLVLCERATASAKYGS